MVDTASCRIAGWGVGVSRVQRYDYVSSGLKPPTKTAENWLRVDGKIARVGIQEYRRADGTVEREYRPAEEVFHPDALASFAGVPVTNQHPTKLLDDKDAKQYAVGSLSGVRADGDKWVAGSLLIFDAAAVASVEGGRQQLSMGYSCALDPTPGEYQGQKYDSVQRAVRANHCAICDVARAGPEARLRLDSTDAESALDAVPDPALPSIREEKSTMALKFRIDGFEIEVADANAQAVIERAIANARKDAESKQDAAEKALVAEKKLTADEKARADALKAKLDKMVECDTCDGKGKIGDKDCKDCGGEGEYSEKSDADEVLVKRRASRKAAVEAGRADALAKLPELAKINTECVKYLGPDHKIDTSNAVAMQKAVAVKLNPELKLDGKSNDYVLAMYDAELAKKAKEPNASDRAREGALKIVPNTDEAPSDPEAARKAYAQRQADAWKPKK